MSGHFLEKNTEDFRYTTKKHNNIAFYYGEKLNKVIYFHDYRNFGTFSFSLDLEKKLNKIGMDLLEINSTFEDFYDIIRKKRNDKIISEILLEQKYFSGIGNYCRSEALYLANINPFIKIKNMTREQLETLFYWIRVVLFYHYNVKLGIKIGIIKKKDLTLLPEKYGANGKDFNRYFVVYGQEKDPFGKQIFRIKDSHGRTIHTIFKKKIYN